MATQSRREFIWRSGVLLSSLAFCRAAFGGAGDAAGWRSVAGMPHPVQEIYPALLGDVIHVAGGFSVENDKVGATNRHLSYSIAGDQWQLLNPLPEVRHHLALATCAGQLYALGGFASAPGAPWSMQNQSWRYDPDQDQWADVQPAPEVHAESVCLARGDLIHIIGGRRPKNPQNKHWGDHTDSNRHLIFEPATNSWRAAAPAPSARNSAAGCVINDCLYIAGGRTVTSGNLNTLEVYDAKEDRWRTAQPLPQVQGALAAAAVNGELIAFGGEFFGGTGGFGVYSEVWRYDPMRDHWRALPNMKTPRHGLGAVSYGSSVFAIGGATDVATRGTSAVVERLDLGA